MCVPCVLDLWFLTLKLSPPVNVDNAGRWTSFRRHDKRSIDAGCCCRRRGVVWLCVYLCVGLDRAPMTQWINGHTCWHTYDKRRFVAVYYTSVNRNHLTPLGSNSVSSICCGFVVQSVYFVPSVLWRCWLGGRKGIRPVKKNWAVGCWRGYLSGVRCRLAYVPADSTATHCRFLQ